MNKFINLHTESDGTENSKHLAINASKHDHLGVRDSMTGSNKGKRFSFLHHIKKEVVQNEDDKGLTLH